MIGNTSGQENIQHLLSSNQTPVATGGAWPTAAVACEEANQLIRALTARD